jgi:hypothetical protein
VSFVCLRIYTHTHKHTTCSSLNFHAEHDSNGELCLPVYLHTHTHTNTHKHA